MKYTLYILITCASLLFASCDLLSPDEVENPNVEESAFSHSSGAMAAWVNGTNANFAVGVAKFAELTGLLSDDLFNNSSRSSKTYDVLDIQYTDVEVSTLSTHIGRMLQMTEYGLTTLAKADANTTQAQLFNLYYIRIYACLLAAENFVALPVEARGEILDASQLAQKALDVASEAEQLAQNNAQKALIALLKARATRLLGDLSGAATLAQQSLSYDAEIAFCTQFDGLNGFANSLQEMVATDLFTILPRLQQQKAKLPMDDYFNQPICFAKSEEAYLIMAEAQIANGEIASAQETINKLIDLVNNRAANGKEQLSITSVTTTDVEQAGNRSQLLELLYLLRQELFFGEGRRSSDLGIRLPLSEVEFNEHNGLPASYSKPIIPDFLKQIKAEVDKHEDINSLLVGSLFSD